MKRILKALSAFALSLVFTLALAVLPVSAAENALSGDVDGNYAGYLVVLREPQAVAYSADPLAAATLMSAWDERDDLLELAGDWNIYKAGTLSEIQSLVYSGQVAVVEPDYKAELFDVVPVEPDDPLFTSNKNNVNGQSALTGAYGIHVRSAWEAGLTGKGVTVAVIDSGLHDSHEDAPTRVGRGRYFFYQEETDAEKGRYQLTVNGKLGYYSYWSSGDWDDNVGHGSMVCGIIAAAANNGKGIAGIAPDVTILPIRCFTNTPGHVGGYTSNLISGLNYAVENGADIINMSWGVTQYSSSLQTAVDAAYQAGCILIAAAGNDGTVINQYPAAWDNVISVGSVDQSGRLTSYSQRVSSVNICAPGGTTSDRVVSLGYASDTSYLSKIGTSFSTPAVAGAAALLLQADPTMTQGDFLSLLDTTSTLLANESDRLYSGAGWLNLQALLDEVGYTGSSAKRTGSGISVYAAHHPTGSSPQNVIAMVAGYNEAGHLVESHSASLSKSGYNNFAKSFTFQNPDIAQFQTYYLDPTTFAALDKPIVPVLE